MSSPAINYWAALEQSLCYLKGPPRCGLLYANHRPTNSKCFSYADWAKSKFDERSTAGHCVFVGGNLFS